MIQKDMYGNYEWSTRPKLMLQSFSFFDESDDRSPLKFEDEHREVLEKAKEKYHRAKEKVKKVLHI